MGIILTIQMYFSLFFYNTTFKKLKLIHNIKKKKNAFRWMIINYFIQLNKVFFEFKKELQYTYEKESLCLFTHSLGY